MPRQIITERRLVTRLNEKLSKGKNCCDHTVSTLMRVDKNNNAGCNWTISVMSCCGSFTSAGNREAEQLIESFQGLYNLQEGTVIGPRDTGDAPGIGASA